MKIFIAPLVLCILWTPGAGSQETDPDRIDEAIRRGVEYIIRMQRRDGTWNNYSPSNNIGQTALCALALKKAGLPGDHPAILKALNFLTYHPPRRTYDVAVLLVLLEAMGPEGHVEWIEALGAMLAETQTGRLWSYPVGAVDLSNTQYAVLGLRSAVACGVRIGSEVWRDLIEGILDYQNEDGGWGYRRNHQSTGAMTCAGLTCLLVAKEALQAKNQKVPRPNQIQAALEEGYAWLDVHFKADRNPRPYEDPKHYRWTYYYLYGVERIGSLSGLKEFGNQDWYQAGADWLLARQGERGNWTSAYGEGELNTAFAVLFLSRATLGGRTRDRLESRVVSDASNPDKGKQDFGIGCDRKNPGYLWIESWSPKIAKEFGIDGGQRKIRVDKVEYFAGDALLGTVEEEPPARRITRFSMPYRFASNGEYELHARITCSSRHGTRQETFESGRIKLFVHNVVMKEDLAAMEDVGRNLFREADPRVAVSSRWSGDWSGKHAVDQLHGTSWLSAKGEVDDAPWIEILLDRGVRANLLKVTHKHGNPFEPKQYGRAVRVRVLINRGAQKIETTLGDEQAVKYAIPFKTTRVREIRIEMLERAAGSKNIAAGFAEVELFYVPSK